LNPIYSSQPTQHLFEEDAEIVQITFQ
jgi:hypothetical protein